MTNWLRLRAKQLKRLPMSMLLHDLISWEPQGDTVAGYSIVLACMRELTSLAIANVRQCARQKNTRLHEIILVFDCPSDSIPAEVYDAVRENSALRNVRILGYDARQHWVARRINWGWVYSWMSWSLAFRQARTRAVIIHDLDALPLYPELFEKIYDHWLEEKAEFCGIHEYEDFINGIDKSMNLVVTPELIFDVSFIRSHFSPFDLFNKLRMENGRVVDFDTMLYAQWQSPRRLVRPIDETWLVHPRQLICNYTDLVSGRSDFRGQNHSLPILPYFMYLGGDPESLTKVGSFLVEFNAKSINLFGRDARIDGITPQHWAWIEKQIRRLEQGIFGETRPEVERYLSGIVPRAGSHRMDMKSIGPT